ncbi:MAG: extracellular solute-binding protein [Clostridia bacterium]|nr:extracellular solute-binding protein [Clostridia bacterium]MDD7699936.1 extracellular solute-binding protein [Eubacteriales bacterium]MDY2827177.1 extracellular solute-binding protein [Eubacteriales bacterium]
MKKKTFQRLLAIVLALTFLVGGVVTTSAATTPNGSVTTKTLAEIKEQLNAVSYEDYLIKYQSVPRATASILIRGTENYSYEGSDSVREVTEDGSSSLYTPSTGTTSWKVTIPTTAKYSVMIEYWPDSAKSASIERILKIDGKIPFAEARFLSLPKVWTNQYVNARVTATKDKTLQALYDEAIAAGFDLASCTMESDEKGAYLSIAMPAVWTQSVCDFVNTNTVRFMTADIDQNELRPNMEQSPEWRSVELRDADGFYAETFEFVLEAGERTLSLEAVNEPMTIRSITLVPHKDLMTYENYKARFAGAESGRDWVRIQAEYPGATSSQTIYPVEDRTDAATMPSNTSRVLLNTIGGEKWETAGQWVRYTFKVGTSGLYNIAARYRQNVLDGMYVCRSIYIESKGAAADSLGYYDGSVPFYEATELRFNYSSDWQSTLLNNGGGQDYEFYFEAGVEYTITLQVGLGSIGDVVRRVEAALDAINSDYLEIIKLTGASPDEYRDYGFSRVMPDTMIDMILRSRELYEISAEMVKITGQKSSSVATLEKVAWLLERMGSNEDEIAKYLEQLKSYIGSLGTWLGDAKTQPLQLDYLVVQPLNSDLPKAKAGFFSSFAHEIKSFVMSFFRNYNRMGATTEDTNGEHTVDVWLAYGRDQAQVIRGLINNDFTPSSEHNTAVNLKLVAGGTLLPSVLAGMGPDVYIGLGEGDVINYAIRGALIPIEKMEGFKDFALYYQVDEHFNTVYDADGNPIVNPNAQFNNAAMLVMGIADANNDFHYYGLPETQNFEMMFVREDVLADLGIEIPKTWDDILAAIPTLQANNMLIGMHTNYKVFLYQMNGTLFADDGMRINLDSDVGLTAFETMCNYFTMYSFPYKYDFANRFRTGEMPIGFASYNGTYNHLTVFATEIKGLWNFYPMPGIEYTKQDGSTYINNVSVSSTSAIVMMTGCDNETGAWEFMRWHSGADCQIKYSNEMVAIIGPSAKHATANIKALAEMPWTSAEYEQLSYQFNNLASIPNYPGSYIISRYTQFAFLAAYEKNANPTTELQSYISTINKEITRKREEFGLETLELGQTLKGKRLTQFKTAFEADCAALGEGDSRVTEARTHLATILRYITEEQYDNVDPLELQKIGESLDATAFAGTITAIKNAVTVMTKK